MTSRQLVRGLGVSTNGFKVQIEAVEDGIVTIKSAQICRLGRARRNPTALTRVCCIHQRHLCRLSCSEGEAPPTATGTITSSKSSGFV